MRESEIAILRALDESGGFTIRDISRNTSQWRYCNFNMHARSGAIKSELIDMSKRGLVARLDDLKPVAWVRTAAGTKALESLNGQTGGNG